MSDRQHKITQPFEDVPVDDTKRFRLTMLFFAFAVATTGYFSSAKLAWQLASVGIVGFAWSTYFGDWTVVRFKDKSLVDGGQDSD